MSFDARHDRPLSGLLRPALPERAGLAAGIALSHSRVAARVAAVRSALTNAGIELTGPHAGRVAVGDQFADVQLEPDDVILLRVPAPGDEPRALLERSAVAAGNIRFAAIPRRAGQLLADTRVNGVAHLPRSLRGICRGLAVAAAGRDAEPEEAGAAAEVALRDAVAEAGWPREDAVEIPGGYELHLPIEGIRTAVSVTAEGASVRVQRTVVGRLPAGSAGSAVAHQSLMFNGRLRHCRLALSDGRLCVECRLHAGQLTGEWVSHAVRAVASAARVVSPELELLCREPAVADEYAAMFLAGP
jgi:hypothetical protein